MVIRFGSDLCPFDLGKMYESALCLQHSSEHFQSRWNFWNERQFGRGLHAGLTNVDVLA